ncbi:nitrogen regulation protein NR(II) [Lysinibacillus sp. NPDC097287]|uniref:two-component system sensor histidine kinase NtrB n=1 Tax=Lysinibacillus sp. NPDC097287 TaxID=3364144 RepID=UPI003817947F
MLQIDLLRMRNEIIFIFSMTAILIQCFLAMLGLNGNFYVLLAALLLLLIPLIIGKILKVNPIIMQWIIMICGNLTIFFINIFSVSVINLLCFIFYLLLISIYRSLKINAIFSIVTLIEIIFIINHHQVLSESMIEKQFLHAFIFVVLLLTTICWIQTHNMKRFWHKLDQTNLQKQQELLSQEAYLHLFFEHANDSIAVLSLDNRIIDINPAFEEVYGWKRSECIGKVIPVVPPENSIDAENRYHDLLEGKSVKMLETKDMRKDGTVFDAAISLSPIYDLDGKMIATSVISRDITHEKENKQLILQSEKLKLAGEIAAGVAHEIRNPLTVISGFVQMMNSDKESPYHSYTEIIQSEIERINLIISEFLVLSKPQANQLKAVSIAETINNVSNFFHLEFLNRGITFSLSVNSVQNMVLANENQLKQVFINIIKNAIEAIDMHDVEGKICFSINNVMPNTIHIAISDNGIGMSENLLERIFEPFYTTKATGTGLGMLITNKIIQDHGGTIEIESKLENGTTINIKLPSI